MDKPGRALAIARLIRLVGPHEAVRLVKLADEESAKKIDEDGTDA